MTSTSKTAITTTTCSRCTLLWSLVAVIFAVYGVSFYQFLEKLRHHEPTFFKGNSEVFYMLSMPGWLKFILSKLSFIEPSIREVLAADSHHSHTSHRQWYNKTKHDRVHRKLVRHFLNDDECATIRSIMDRNTLTREQAYLQEEAGANSLWMEFESMSLAAVLLNQDSAMNVTREEQRLISLLMQRLQETMEETFGTDSIFLEFADLTRRQRPTTDDGSTSTKSSNTSSSPLLDHFHYLSTGGHKVHCDMCQLLINKDVLLDSWDCDFEQDSCCAHRTHTVLLYLNDDNSNLRGGQVFLLDRQDIKNESVSSFDSDVGLREAFLHSVQLQPSCGNLLVFASDTRNLHGVLPILQGARYAMPMWFTSLEDLSWDPYDAHVLESHLEKYFWRQLRGRCQSMAMNNNDGVGFAMPSGFRHYAGDCDGMVEAAKKQVYKSKTRKLREARVAEKAQ